MQSRPPRTDLESELPPVMRQRCKKHNLAVGAGGQCVRCRKEDELRAASVRSRWPGWPLVLSITCTLGVLGYLFFGPRPSPEVELSPAPVKEVVVLKPDSRVRWELLGSSSTAEPSAGQGSGSANRGAAAAPRLPDSGLRGLLALPADYLLQVRAASRRLRIYVYYTSWCPACTKARTWMDQNTIGYTGHDIERTEGALKELKKINPANTIPTILVGRQVLTGFSSSRLCRAILAEAGR